MANLPARKYRRSDADRLELNVKSVQAMMAKYHLTTQDILTGLRYKVPKARWEESLEDAQDSCRQYEAYHDVDSEETLKIYGDE